MEKHEKCNIIHFLFVPDDFGFPCDIHSLRVDRDFYSYDVLFSLYKPDSGISSYFHFILFFTILYVCVCVLYAVCKFHLSVIVVYPFCLCYACIVTLTKVLPKKKQEKKKKKTQDGIKKIGGK